MFEKTQDVEFEIIVVDNASSDGSQQMVKELFPKVTLIESPENLGFGRANNLGNKVAKGKYLFILNSDTILIENSIKKLYDFYIENEAKLKIGILGCQLIDEKGNPNSTWRKFPTANSEIKGNIVFIINILTCNFLHIISRTITRNKKPIPIITDKRNI